MNDKSKLENSENMETKDISSETLDTEATILYESTDTHPPAEADDQLSPDEFRELTDEEAAELAGKYDMEANYRKFKGVPKIVIRWMCIMFSVFMLVINIWPLLVPQVHRASFVGLVVMLAFLLYPARKKNNSRINYIPWYDFILAVVGLICYFYYVFNFRTIVAQNMRFTTLDFIFAIAGVIILFIACKRVVGIPLMVVVGGFIAYFFFGGHIPGIFGHPGVWDAQFIFTRLFYDLGGVLNVPIGVAATFIFVFMLFGASLEKTGIGQLFIDISNKVAGRATGGPAKVAVIVSALEGSVSGSSVANTVASGSFTIPMMKKMGYEKNFAGAVEAAASTGGQLVPPILGAAAFLMAEITGIPFTQIAIAAIVPSILYFAGVFAAVHYEAKKKKLRGMPADAIPSFKAVFERLHLVLGIAAIIFFLAKGFTPTRSALLAILVSIIVSMFRRDTRITPSKALDILETGARNTIGVAVACAMAGMIVGVVTITGLGNSFIGAMLNLATGIEHETVRIFIVLLFCMVACLILGLGVPTTAKYVIMATIAAPILTSSPLYVNLLAAHMFVFYFATDADITPPVGLAAYAGAAISKGSPIRTCLIATRLAVAAYIVPYIFVFSPQMLFVDATIFEVILLTLTGMVGVFSVAAGLTGFYAVRMQWFERVFAITGGIMLIDPGFLTSAIGVSMMLAVMLFQRFKFIRNKKEAAA